MINKNLLKNIEKLGDYSQDLKLEIEEAVAQISSKPYLADEILIKLNYKLQAAKSEWVNINTYEWIIEEFRLTLFSSNIANFEERIINPINLWNFNLDIIESEYSTLVKSIDDKSKLNDLKDKYNYVTNLKLKEEIRFKINHMLDNWLWTNYELDQITNDFQLLKDKGVDIDDLEELIMW